jgi:hypothetical protein
MGSEKKKHEEFSANDSGKWHQSAVPYIPPPPPEPSIRKKFGAPLVNGMIVAVIILLFGFMLYHFIGYELTHVASVSQSNTTSTVSTAPGASSGVSPSVAVSPSP